MSGHCCDLVNIKAVLQKIRAEKVAKIMRHDVRLNTRYLAVLIQCLIKRNPEKLIVTIAQENIGAFLCESILFSFFIEIPSESTDNTIHEINRTYFIPFPVPDD